MINIPIFLFFILFFWVERQNWELVNVHLIGPHLQSQEMAGWRSTKKKACSESFSSQQWASYSLWRFEPILWFLSPCAVSYPGSSAKSSVPYCVPYGALILIDNAHLRTTYK